MFIASDCCGFFVVVSFQNVWVGAIPISFLFHSSLNRHSSPPPPPTPHFEPSPAFSVSSPGPLSLPSSELGRYDLVLDAASSKLIGENRKVHRTLSLAWFGRWPWPYVFSGSSLDYGLPPRLGRSSLDLRASLPCSCEPGPLCWERMLVLCFTYLSFQKPFSLPHPAKGKTS